MTRLFDRFLLVLVLVLALLFGLISKVSADLEPPQWMRLGAWPMCIELPAECRPYKSGELFEVALTRAKHLELDRINRVVNTEVQYVGDLAHYAQLERWTYPVDGMGDCEDYALEKRKRLIALGWPRRALLIAVVAEPAHTAERGLHAVLIVRTDAGDLVLDNKRESVMEIAWTGYGRLWTQSQWHPSEYIREGLK